ncbi:MAG: DUF5132 domain-containing protein [Candidatus Magnetobacterium sp. LHC-1]|nr:DUF5132 domain-containing protein [Nitrospirota bacterium]
MALSDLLEGEGLIGLAIGVGVGIVAVSPKIISAAISIAKPTVKALVKGGLIAYEKSAVVVAEAMEGLEDIVAEVKAEMAETNISKTSER